jgi:hypothetical protein
VHRSVDGGQPAAGIVDGVGVASQIYRVLTHLGVDNHVVNSNPGMAAARAGPTVKPGPLRRMGAAQRLAEEGAITRL